MTRRLPVLAIALLSLVLPAAAGAAERQVAPPASQRAIEACGVRAEAQQQTADIERVVRGVGTLGGCVTDVSGIAHMFLEWSSADGRERGRICVDPPVRDNLWTCAWDTTGLEPGSYRVHMIAVDAAGNRGESDQAYRVEPPAAAPDDEEPDAAVPEAEGSAEPVAPAEPAEPAEPVDPAEPSDPVEPVEPDASTPADPLVIAPPVSAPVAQLVADRIADCSRLELAPGVAADRALSLAVVDCMRPALEAIGAVQLALDEIPVPPSIVVAFADAASLAAADELLPDQVGGVALELEHEVELELATEPGSSADGASSERLLTPVE